MKWTVSTNEGGCIINTDKTTQKAPLVFYLNFFIFSRVVTVVLLIIDQVTSALHYLYFFIKPYSVTIRSNRHTIWFGEDINAFSAEPHLCLCKQVGSRPAAELLGGWPEIQPVFYFIISHKKKQNVKGLKSRRQYNLFLENYPAFKGLITSLPGQSLSMHNILSTSA